MINQDYIIMEKTKLRISNQLLRASNFEAAVRGYLEALSQTPQLRDPILFNLSIARKRYRTHRQDKPQKVAVCGWELAHNAAGRVYTLAKLYETFAEVEIIGSLFSKWGREIWKPIRNTTIHKHTFLVEEKSRFIEQALELVAAHPYDIVHLSKPRMPNIFFGLLYKLVWGAKVLVDIDDEELAFVDADTPLSVEDYIQTHGVLPELKQLLGKEWTRIAVGLAKEFDGITVSNPALQQRYGGEIIRHARDEKLFRPSPDLKKKSRKSFCIPLDKKVVLFLGTPREHKGLLETAEAISSLKRDDVLFVIVGDFPDPDLKKRLCTIKGVEYRFIENQPFDNIHDVVAMGDYCLLLQNNNSSVSNYQVPAKLTDALAIGLVVLVRETPALADLVKSKAVVTVSPGDLAYKLREQLQKKSKVQVGNVARHVFEQFLSFAANSPVLEKCALLSSSDRAISQLHGALNNLLLSAIHDAKPPIEVQAKEKVVVYSCNFGNYESVKEPLFVDPTVEYILFTDNKDLKTRHWKVVYLEENLADPRRISRLPKILPHKYLPPHDVSVYIDSSLEMKTPDVRKMIDECLEGMDIAMYKHYLRDCVYEEIEYCANTEDRAVDRSLCEKTIEKYRNRNYPKKAGLFENAFIIRHNTDKIRKLNEKWWEEYSKSAERDQFTFMYCLWNLGIVPNTIKYGEQFRINPYTNFSKHKYKRFDNKTFGHGNIKQNVATDNQQSNINLSHHKKCTSVSNLINKVPIVLSFDTNYFIPAGATITSLLENASKQTYYDIYLFADDVRNNIRQKFKSFEKSYTNCRISFLDSNNAYKDIKAYNAGMDYLTKSSSNYYRFLIPELLKEYSKIIWCDVDIIIRKDLAHLLEIDMNGNYLIACRELLLSKQRKVYSKKIGVSTEKYFNAGFGVWNLDLMRKDCAMDKINKIIYESNVKFMTPTQDPMNILFQDKTIYLDNRYNFNVYAWYLSLTMQTENILDINDTNKRIRNALNDIKVLHFCGPDKPWDYYYYPFAKEWRHYFNKSPFSNIDLVYQDFDNCEHVNNFSSGNFETMRPHNVNNTSSNDNDENHSAIYIHKKFLEKKNDTSTKKDIILSKRKTINDLENLKNLIDKHKYISFDVFDTLILRPYIEPSHLFHHMESIFNIDGFFEERQNVRKKIFDREIGRQEIPLDEMYQELDPKFKKYYPIEKEIEYTCCSANQEMFAIYKYALISGKPILLISDTYFDKIFLEKVLAKTGYVDYYKIYVSSEVGLRKHTGDLFKKVKNDFKLKYSDILHIGDNKHADYDIPKRLGISAYHYKTVSDNFFSLNQREHSFFSSINNLNAITDTSIIYGIRAKNLTKNLSKGYWFNFGYNYAGPIVYSFVQWLYNSLSKSDIKDIAFIAREGYILKKVFDLFDYDNKFATKYVYLNRMISTISSINKVEDIDNFFKTSLFSLDNAKYIIDALSTVDSSLGMGDLNNFLENKDNAYKYFIKQKLKIFDASTKYRDKIKRYFETENLLSNNIAMVDSISGCARAQKLIKTFCDESNTRVTGYYFYCDQKHKEILQENFAGAGKEDAHNKSKNWHIIEFILTSPELPIASLRYEKGKYFPVYQDSNAYEEDRIAVYPEIANGIVEFVLDTRKYFDKITVWRKVNNIISYLNNFYDTLNEEDFNYFKNIWFSSDHQFYQPFFVNTNIIRKNVSGQEGYEAELKTNNLTAVVVTRNRLNYLKYCIDALLNQTLPINNIIVVNNNSTDSTEEYLVDLSKGNKKITYINSNANIGGAGGFDLGLRKALEITNGWITLMDDDCEVDINCYKNMRNIGMDENNIYVPLRLDTNNKQIITTYSELRGKNISHAVNDYYELNHAPFNGFTIHCSLVRKIGHIEKDLFIYQDDTEYSYRGIKYGSKLILVTKALIYHPDVKKVNLIDSLKAYYENRNFIYVDKKYKKLDIIKYVDRSFTRIKQAFMEYKNYKITNLYIQSFLDGMADRIFVRNDIFAQNETNMQTMFLVSSVISDETIKIIRETIKNQNVFINIYVFAENIERSKLDALLKLDKDNMNIHISYIRIDNLITFIKKYSAHQATKMISELAVN